MGRFSLLIHYIRIIIPPVKSEWRLLYEQFSIIALYFLIISQ